MPARPPDYPACFFPLPRNPARPEKDRKAPACQGYCVRCDRQHSLPEGPAGTYCRELMRRLEQEKRIDFLAAADPTDPRLSTDHLFSEARGQMFGVMVCRHRNGTPGLLYAFSGQYRGIMAVDGWVPPLFNVAEVAEITLAVEREIKHLGGRIARADKGSPERTALTQQRRALSRRLMKDLHSRYVLTNFHGTSAALPAAFNGAGIPTGAGECCAPKLLNYAAQHGLTPLGLAEFYWGRENRSRSRQHGRFYSACAEKCQPLIGFLLCGLDRQDG